MGFSDDFDGEKCNTPPNDGWLTPERLAKCRAVGEKLGVRLAERLQRETETASNPSLLNKQP